jgi:hypothetical protein
VKKEGRRDIAELPASLRVKWKDCPFGKDSRISIGFQEDHNFEPVSCVTPLYKATAVR